jgi:hemerythrin
MEQWILWMNTYNVRVSGIDERHREMFRRLHELTDAFWDGKSKDAIEQLLDFTANYADTHFSAEEQHMKNYDFPVNVGHKKLRHDCPIRFHVPWKEFLTRPVGSVVLNLVRCAGKNGRVMD